MRIPRNKSKKFEDGVTAKRMSSIGLQNRKKAEMVIAAQKRFGKCNSQDLKSVLKGESKIG